MGDRVAIPRLLDFEAEASLADRVVTSRGMSLLLLDFGGSVFSRLGENFPDRCNCAAGLGEHQLDLQVVNRGWTSSLLKWRSDGSTFSMRWDVGVPFPKR